MTKEEFKQALDEFYEKNKNDKRTTSTAPSALSILGVGFIILKILGKITWSWWWVLAPFWMPAALVILLLIIVVIICLLAE